MVHNVSRIFLRKLFDITRMLKQYKCIFHAEVLRPEMLKSETTPFGGWSLLFSQNNSRLDKELRIAAIRGYLILKHCCSRAPQLRPIPTSWTILLVGNWPWPWFMLVALYGSNTK